MATLIPLPRRTSRLALPQLRRMRLTEREQEVLAMLVEGVGNREMGERLGISARTVEVHRRRVMEKSDARNAAELVRMVVSPR